MFTLSTVENSTPYWCIHQWHRESIVNSGEIHPLLMHAPGKQRVNFQQWENPYPVDVYTRDTRSQLSTEGKSTPSWCIHQWHRESIVNSWKIHSLLMHTPGTQGFNCQQRGNPLHVDAYIHQGHKFNFQQRGNPFPVDIIHQGHKVNCQQPGNPFPVDAYTSDTRS